MFYVYILRTSYNTLYVGQTNNLEKRVIEHEGNKGARYIKYFKSFKLVHSEVYNSRSDAMKREAELKSWTKFKKEALIKNGDAKRHPRPFLKLKTSEGRERN